eukprot:364935-Chlamydomonas_euryale.AAC.2
MPSGAAKLLRLITAASASTPARDVADGSSLPSAQSPTWSVARASGSPLRSAGVRQWQSAGIDGEQLGEAVDQAATWIPPGQGDAGMRESCRAAAALATA